MAVLDPLRGQWRKRVIWESARAKRMNVGCLITREKTLKGHARMGNGSKVSRISVRQPAVDWAPLM